MLRKIIKKILNEATSTQVTSGPVNIPLQPGTKLFDHEALDPFNIQVSKYDDALLQYDSYDGKMSYPKKKIQKMEKKAVKISKMNKKHPVQNDEEGGVLNQFPDGKKKKIKMKDVSKPYEPINEWVEIDENIISEDLAVWFGKKKKPKGSKQPKGPWVNICRKVDGKHPPCGRPEAGSKGYPKCRAAGVAGKMSDSQKKAACSQKRRAEKAEPKVGKGNKPTMTSYKPRKESIDEIITRVIKEEIKKLN